MAHRPTKYNIVAFCSCISEYGMNILSAYSWTMLMLVVRRCTITAPSMTFQLQVKCDHCCPGCSRHLYKLRLDAWQTKLAKHERRGGKNCISDGKNSANSPSRFSADLRVGIAGQYVFCSVLIFFDCLELDLVLYRKLLTSARKCILIGSRIEGIDHILNEVLALFLAVSRSGKSPRLDCPFI